VLIEHGGVRLLTDPLLRGGVAHLRRRTPDPAVPEDVDAVLLSHLHYDHLDVPSLRWLGGPRIVAPRGAGEFLLRAGFHRVDELVSGERTAIGDLNVQAVPAVHADRRRPGGGPRAQPLGYVISGEREIYFAGDTDLFEGMAELRGLDLALLPVAGYAPRLGPGHMDAGRAAEAAALMRPRVAVPIHWGTFSPVTSRLGPWFTDPPRKFAAQVAELAPEVEVRVLAPGDSTEL